MDIWLDFYGENFAPRESWLSSGVVFVVPWLWMWMSTFRQCSGSDLAFVWSLRSLWWKNWCSWENGCSQKNTPTRRFLLSTVCKSGSCNSIVFSANQHTPRVFLRVSDFSNTGRGLRRNARPLSEVNVRVCCQNFCLRRSRRGSRYAPSLTL